MKSDRLPAALRAASTPERRLILVSPEPVDPLRAALQRLHSACVGMDHPDQMQRTEEAEYLAAMEQARGVLGCSGAHVRQQRVPAGGRRHRPRELQRARRAQGGAA